MTTGSKLEAHAWAERTFGTAQLGDQRRTTRLVQVATHMAQAPDASLPLQMEGKRADLKATYRLLHEADVTHEALLGPHWQQTREQAHEQERTVLLVHDDTELDYGYDPAVKGLGPIGNGSHWGFFVHSVLAVVPMAEQERVLGLVYQDPWVREPAPRRRWGQKQNSKQRAHRERESQHWSHAIRQVGTPAAGECWVHVGDRYADMYEFLLAGKQMGCEVLVRVVQNRRLHNPQPASQEADYLIDRMKSWSAQGNRVKPVPSEHERRARQARLCISWGQVDIQPSDLHGRVRKEAPVLRMWAVHVWEPDPPLRSQGQRPRVRSEKHGAVRKRAERKKKQAKERLVKPKEPEQEERVEPLEWFLLSSLPVESEAQAWQAADWYGCRWSVEDLHKGLKTGCQIEERHLRDQASLQRLLGIVSPIAVRLLQLRELLWAVPEQPVLGWVSQPEAQVIAWQEQEPTEQLSVRRFLRAVAQMGGFLGRSSDGEPGWQTLWRGWVRLQWKVEGLRLATEHSPPKKCGSLSGQPQGPHPATQATPCPYGTSVVSP
jgi:hypothetical protein